MGTHSCSGLVQLRITLLYFIYSVPLTLYGVEVVFFF
jgi:hypothetical protein